MSGTVRYCRIHGVNYEMILLTLVFAIGHAGAAEIMKITILYKTVPL